MWREVIERNKIELDGHVLAVIQHVGGQYQVVVCGFGEEVARLAQLHAIELRIGAAGGQGQRIQVAGHDFGRTRACGGNARDA